MLTQEEVAAPFIIERMGLLMQPDPLRPEESEGVLNPAAVRAPDDTLYLFPRLVGPGNYSRVGIAQVRFDDQDRPSDVTRLGVALEPREPYERRGDGGGGCEDPRVSYIAPLSLYVMAYVAWGPGGPRLALAVSHTLRSWERLGPVVFQTDPLDGMDFNTVDNKDGAFFPTAVQGPDGRPALAVLHRPVYSANAGRAGLPAARPGIWISYCAMDDVRRDLRALLRLSGHQLVMEPVAPWEGLRIGAGTPPLWTSLGWLLLYHGVSGHIASDAADGQHVRYAAGVAILDGVDPRRVLYRSPRALLEPETEAEAAGTALGVVFPTGLDDRGGGQIDVFYGMADVRIGVARLRIRPADDALGACAR